ncbi:hypothetical protein [Paenisporosarcina cavernae]|uniref:Uncharacterized protein n=1 Tax=Paenisporosarcina cavernae TaxID=2320858 RepID=A0A385YPB6_9BACL|nr:hypothetical protein [Paenisporosarcina cavernae]AYC28426.1 hypothetical protein D3873_00525 [Paenisporosarcina cavernae]
MDPFDKDVSTKLKRYVNEHVSFSANEKNNVFDSIQKIDKRSMRFQPTYWVVLSFVTVLIVFFGKSFISEWNVQDSLSANPPSESSSEINYLDELNNVQLTVTDRTELPDHVTTYTIEIQNTSMYPILDGELFLSYDIKLPNGQKENPFKVEIELPDEIKPGAHLNKELIVPNNLFQPDMVNTKEQSLSMHGFIHKKIPANRFSILRSMSEDTEDEGSLKLQ